MTVCEHPTDKLDAYSTKLATGAIRVGVVCNQCGSFIVTTTVDPHQEVADKK